MFALLANELHAESGDVYMPASWRIARVAQETPALPDSAIDFVLDGDTDLRRVERELAVAEAVGDGEAIGHLHARYGEIEGYSAKARVAEVLHGLGFADADFRRPVSEFSGGWRVRLNLARALSCRADLLLLDEPTNHLDLDAVFWLEQWLKNTPATLLLISHDRDFLDAVVGQILSIDLQRLTLTSGGYSDYERARAARLANQQSAYEAQQREIAHLNSFIDRFRAKATKARQAQSRIKMLERMETVAAAHVDSPFHFSFRQSNALPDPLLTIEKASAGYVDRNILENITLTLRPGCRIGLLGRNGAGKSTLIKLLAGAIEQQGGQRKEAKALNLGYFAQHQLEQLRPDESPLQHLARLEPTTPEQELRDYLGGFDFRGDMASRAIEPFSGGEKSRLALALLIRTKPNLLLLDEPTNHLDLATREALSLALNEFEGTVIVVSHDRSLLRSVCDEFWLVTRGGVQDFAGDLDDYQRYLLDEARRNRESLRESARNAKKPASRDAAPVSAGKKTSGNLKALARDQQRIEQSLLVLQAEQRSLEARLAISLSPQDLAVIGRRLEELAGEMTTLENQWLTLSDQIDMATRPIPS